MRLLVLGGTVFLSRAVAEEAVRRGHEVTAACRGESGTLPGGVVHLAWDRTEDPPAGLTDGRWDAVVDVARHPSWVRRAVAAVPDAHWVFVSTISVYADEKTRGGTPDTLPLHEPIHTDEDISSSPEAYGGMKVACEQVVREGTASAAVVRPGLIVGPGDPSGRYSYWPERLADAAPGEEVLAPGSPDDVVQVIDVRDLAGWLVDLAEARREGVLDASGASTRLEDVLARTAAGVGADPTWAWRSHQQLEESGVAPWVGERSLPLWLPRPDYDGMMDHDLTAAFEAGLTTRPIAETARDTLAWLRATPDAARTGLTRAEEAELLR